jgi:hypothetical protein
MSDYDFDTCDNDDDRYGARIDAGQSAYEKRLHEILDPLVDAEIERRVAAIKATDPNAVHVIAEGRMRVEIEKELRPQAVETLRETEPYE